MSKVKIQGNASGTGVLTIEAPNTNTDRSLTLPDGAGEILLANGDGSNLTGITTGKLLQVVQGTYNTQTNITSTTLQTLGLSASITPSSTSNKIKVTLTLPIRRGSGASNSGAQVQLTRGGSGIANVKYNFGYQQGASEEFDASVSFCYLDSPSTTSSITYGVKGRTTHSSVPIYYFIDSDMGTLILEEIAG